MSSNFYRILQKTILLTLSSLAIQTSTYATATAATHTNTSAPDTLQQASNASYNAVIDEYKKYLSSVPTAVMDEIKHFRTEIEKINQEKKALYKSLSNETQSYLKAQQDFKKRLPLRMYKDIRNAEADSLQHSTSPVTSPVSTPVTPATTPEGHGSGAAK